MEVIIELCFSEEAILVAVSGLEEVLCLNLFVDKRKMIRVILRYPLWAKKMISWTQLWLLATVQNKIFTWSGRLHLASKTLLAVSSSAAVTVWSSLVSTRWNQASISCSVK